jgi:hypothetical protein
MFYMFLLYLFFDKHINIISILLVKHNKGLNQIFLKITGL